MERPRLRVKRRTVYVVTIVALVLSVAGVALASVLIGTQTVPTQTAPSSTMELGCTGTLTVIEIDSYTQFGDGDTSFGCSSGAAAFTVIPSSGTYTPTFTLGSGYTDLWVFSSTTGSLEGGGTGSASNPAAAAELVELTSGTPATLSGPSGETYYYCADFATSAGGTLGSFSISWAQP